MPHFIFLLSTFTLVTLGAWTAISLLLFIQSRKQLLAWESAVGCSLIIITTGILLKYYSINCDINLFIPASILSSIGSITTLFTLTVFTHILAGIPFSPPRRLLIVGISFTLLLLLLLMPQYSPDDFSGPFSHLLPENSYKAFITIYGIIFYGLLGFTFFTGLFAGRSIGDRILKKVRTVTFSTCFIFLAPLIFFYLTGSPHAIAICIAMLFTSIAVENLIFAVMYSSQPSYFTNGAITSHFITRFTISDREKEIIELLLEGKSNKEIANDLFISPRTVENHLSSIYQKTALNSRVQLVNLIRANAAN
jgi:DNA-binding CsgD family transcriptional regulator